MILKRLFLDQLPASFLWVPSKIGSFEAWKPAIRSAVTAWICLVLLLIPSIARDALGQAAFFILISALIAPPSAPFPLFVMQALTFLILVGFAWLYGVMVSAIANAVRVAPSSSFLEASIAKYNGAANAGSLIVYDGAFLSTKSSAVFLVFLGLGTGALAWLKVAFGPRFAIASILASILIDVQLTYGAFIPGFKPGASLGEVSS